MNAEQVYISEKVRNSSNTVINPATEENQEAILEAVDNISLTTSPLVQWDDGELWTKDIGLEKVFWSQQLVDEGRVQTKMVSGDIKNNKKVAWLNSEVRALTQWFTTCNIQLSGTWVGTATFEITSNWWDFIAVAWVNAATNTLAYSATVNGIYRFNVSGLNAIRVRLSAYTSGTALVNFSLSSWSQIQPFAQNAAWAVTISGAVTEAILDTNLPFIAPSQMYETWFELESLRKIDPTVNPTQPTTYAQPKFANYPQRFRRLRVEIGGSERLPLAQETNTNRLVVATPELYRIMEEQLFVLSDIRDLLKIGNNVEVSQ